MHPFRAAFRLPLVVMRHHELLMAFVRRELRARIEGSTLGRVWPVVPARCSLCHLLPGVRSHPENRFQAMSWHRMDLMERVGAPLFI